jgi:serine/threonine protein kinase
MLESGKILQDRYVIQRLLGRGGMGEVYQAHDRRLTCAVAVKKSHFREADEDMRRAFYHEAKLLANLKHPSMPKVSDYFHEGGSEYLVMEFIEGDDLHTQLDGLRQGKPFNFEDVLKWTEEILFALDFLHTRKIIHRDIKPDNLKVNDENRVILLDFGLSKGTTDEMTRPLNNDSIWGYAKHYSSPEQVEGSPTTPRSDLFALAATMYHLLTGVQPAPALKRKTRTAELQPINSLLRDRRLPQIPQEFANLLIQALQLDETKRPESAAEMLHAISRFKDNRRFSGRLTNIIGNNDYDEVEPLEILPDEPQKPPEVHPIRTPTVIPPVKPSPPAIPLVIPVSPVVPPVIPSPPVLPVRNETKALRRKLLVLAIILLLIGSGVVAFYSRTASSSHDLEIRITALPDGYQGLSYNATLEASGGTAPYTWSIDTGILPPGLTMTEKGIIAGSPANVDSKSFVVRVRDATGTARTRSLSIAIQKIYEPPKAKRPDIDGNTVH